MIEESRDLDSIQREQARRVPTVIVTGEADALDFVRRSVGLIGREWEVRGIAATADALAELRGTQVDALFVPIEYLAGSREFSEAARLIDAALIPYRVGSASTPSATATASTAPDSILSLATVSPNRLVAVIEESIERWAHSRALRTEENANAQVDSHVEFLSAVNHEVRTPLNAILGMADFLAESDLDPEHAEKVKIIRSSGRDLLCVLEQLVDLARLRSGEIRHRSMEIDLEGLLYEVADSQSMSIHRKGLGLSVVLDRSLPSITMGDRPRLTQVLSILVRNALRMTVEGEIRVAARPDPEWSDANVVRFEISHTGDSLALDELEVIGNEHLSVSRDHAGLGIGIALADGLVRAMGGRLQFEDEGRSIHFTQIFQPLALRRSEECEGGWLHGVRTMVVSTRSTERVALKTALEGGGALVGQATNRNQAFEAALTAESAGFAYELVLIDEAQCSASLVSELRGLPSGGPRIVAISHAPNGPAMNALEASAVEFVLRTPQKPAAVIAAIESIYAGTPAPELMVSLVASEGRRLLLVDDSPENRRLICMYLKDSGFTIDEASDGQQAVAAFETEVYDLILMDIQMPGVDGYSATRQIRALEADDGGRDKTPIIALTAFSMDEDVDRSLAAGCDAHLTKPVEKKTLLAMIEKHRREQVKAAAHATAALPEELDAEIVALRPTYLENRLTDIDRLRHAGGEGLWEDARIAGHRMAGSGSGYGFPEISELGRQIEAAACALDAVELERLAAQLDETCRRYADELPAPS